MNENEDHLYPSYIANCVLNALSSYTAVMLNIVAIHAMKKTSSLPKPQKTLLLSLAVSDLGVGLVVQPFYIASLVKRLQQNNETTDHDTAFWVIMNLFSCASFFGVLAISVDRFLAIHLHLRYLELVTHKRVVAVVISIWLLSTSFPFMHFLTQSYVGILVILVGLGFICVTLIYLRICYTVRRHRNQIQVLQVHQDAQNDEMTNFARLRKSVVGTFYLYLVSLVCYLPGYCWLISRVTVSETNTNVDSFRLYSWTLLFLNSSLNPVIYCWKMRHIRHAIMDVLRNIFQRHNWGTLQSQNEQRNLKKVRKTKDNCFIWCPFLYGNIFSVFIFLM